MKFKGFKRRSKVFHIGIDFQRFSSYLPSPFKMRMLEEAVNDKF